MGMAQQKEEEASKFKTEKKMKVFFSKLDNG